VLNVCVKANVNNFESNVKKYGFFNVLIVSIFERFTANKSAFSFIKSQVDFTFKSKLEGVSATLIAFFVFGVSSMCSEFVSPIVCE